jgi:hypothetical protein
MFRLLGLQISIEYEFRGYINTINTITTIMTRERCVRMTLVAQIKMTNLRVVLVLGVRRKCLLPERKGTGLEIVLGALTKPKV